MVIPFCQLVCFNFFKWDFLQVSSASSTVMLVSSSTLEAAYRTHCKELRDIPFLKLDTVLYLGSVLLDRMSLLWWEILCCFIAERSCIFRGLQYWVLSSARIPPSHVMCHWKIYPERVVLGSYYCNGIGFTPMEKYIPKLPEISWKRDACLLFEHFINTHLGGEIQFNLCAQRCLSAETWDWSLGYLWSTKIPCYLAKGRANNPLLLGWNTISMSLPWL